MTVEVTIVIKNSTGQVVSTLTDSVSLPSTVTGVDLCYEAVNDSVGGPVVRPKQPPKM